MNLVKTIEVSQESELGQVVEMLKTQILPGDWIDMVGDLGAGKTTFVRRFLLMSGWDDIVTSPTYPLCIEYEVGSQKYLHIDGFRLEGAEEPWDFREWGHAIVFVEWASKTRLPHEKFAWRIQIDVTGETKRTIRVFSVRNIIAS